MKMFSKTFSAWSLLLLALLLAACSDPGSGTDVQPQEIDDAVVATYSVRIENLTTGQPLTPPLLVTHRPAVDLFTVGEPASEGVSEIAENGNLAPLLSALQESRHVIDTVVAAGAPPPLLPGSSIEIELDSRLGAKRLSFVSMLICTNDGFTGIDSLFLPQQVGASTTLRTDAYDAGSEINTEDFADIVPPCPPLTGVDSDEVGTAEPQPALDEGGVIRHHPGISGGADLLPAVHGWTDPVAEVTVTRVR